MSPLGNKDITKSSEHEIVSISHKLGKWISKFTSAFLRSFWELQYKKILHAIDMLDNSKNRHEETERQIHKRKDIISAAQLGGGGGVGLDL